MQRQRNSLVPIGDAFVDLPGPVPSAQARRGFTRFDQVGQLVRAAKRTPTGASWRGSRPAKYRENIPEGRVDTMKPITCLVGATVAVALAACQPMPIDVQVDCADWNNAFFFDEAEAPDVTRCLQRVSTRTRGTRTAGRPC